MQHNQVEGGSYMELEEEKEREVHELRLYLRDEKGQKIGVLVSNTRNSVGWSVCNVHRKDRFNREIGLFKARCREAGNAQKYKAPEYKNGVSILSQERFDSAFEFMMERSRRRF
jgi:hypothetical protein